MKLEKELRVEQRKRDHLLQLVNVILKSTNTLEGDIRINTKRVSIGECSLIFDFAETRRSAAGSLDGIGVERLGHSVWFWKSRSWRHTDSAA